MATLVLFTIFPLAAAASPQFTIVSGITASEEQCLVAEGGGVALDACSSALAAGNGRDVFSFGSGSSGSLKSSGGNCVNVHRDTLVVGACSSQSPSIAISQNGQLQVAAGAETLCVTQEGSFAGTADVALHGAIHSSSDADAFHGASAANDGDEHTFWASSAAGGTEELQIDFGGATKISAFDIKWEAPAQAFSVELLSEGNWVTVFASDINNLHETKGPVPSISATAAKISMSKAHPLYTGRSQYGVREVNFFSNRLSTVLTDCESAATSTDARDKWFLQYVNEADCCPAKKLSALAATADAAQVSLQAATAKLAERVGSLDHCVSGKSFLAAESELAAAAEDGDGSDVLKSARHVISEARSRLASR